MNFEAVFGKSGLDIGVGPEVVKLDEDVRVGESGVSSEFLGVVFHFAKVLPGGLDVMKPVANALEAGECIGIHEGADDAAIGVAADDQVADTKHLDGVFDGGGNAAGGLAGAGNDIAGVAANEEISGLSLEDEIGNDARVGTGDEEILGLLAFGEKMELIATRGKKTCQETLVSLNELLHERRLTSGADRWSANTSVSHERCVIVTTMLSRPAGSTRFLLPGSGGDTPRTTPR